MIGVNAIAGLAKTGLGIIDQLVVDQDKKAEYAFRWNMALLAFTEKMATANTIPWVDGTVKLMYASLALARPVGSFIALLIGVDMATTEGTVDAISGGLMSLFPAWGIARERNKVREAKVKEMKVLKNSEPFDDEDWGD